MNMKKWKQIMSIGLATIGLAAVLTGCGFSNAADNNTQELPKKIVIGLDDNFPPMGFRDEQGNLVGFDIDLAKEAAKRAGMEVEFKPIDWSSKEAELRSKHIDVLWNGLSITPEREKNILFSKPYLKGTQIIIVRNDSDIKTKEDLKGKVVATQQGSHVEPLVEADRMTYGFKDVKTYSDFINAFMDLELGRVDALVVADDVGKYNMTKNPGKFKVTEGTYGADISGIGFRLGDTALKEKFDDILKDMMADGTADKIAEKWFGDTVKLNKEAFK
ncbi:MAG: amino acid ABC transporter substrate-binding protein [Veillonella caviae]|nr:amino acid ABC transporter substrate-binding protein [Veillonella caviae]